MKPEDRAAFAAVASAELRTACIALSKFAVALEKVLDVPSTEATPETPTPAPQAEEALPPARLRALLTAEVQQAIAAGFKAEAREALTKLGAQKLSDLPDDRLAEARAAIAEVARAGAPF